MPRSSLTETIYRVQGMITYARENLSTDEFMLFLDLLVPEPAIEPVKPAKKKRKPRAGRSSRASGMAAAINSSLQQQRTATATEPRCATCGNTEDYADHSQPSPHYHPFESSLRNVVATTGAGIQTADIGPLP